MRIIEFIQNGSKRYYTARDHAEEARALFDAFGRVKGMNLGKALTPEEIEFRSRVGMTSEDKELIDLDQEIVLALPESFRKRVDEARRVYSCKRSRIIVDNETNISYESLKAAVACGAGVNESDYKAMIRMREYVNCTSSLSADLAGGGPPRVFFNTLDAVTV